jgi:co-chaperonin GroES (HSP10)
MTNPLPEPLNDYLLIEWLKEKKTAGGIMLPDNKTERGQLRIGRVLVVGPGKTHHEACRNQHSMPVDLWARRRPGQSIGDLIAYVHRAGYTLEWGGREYDFVQEEFVICRLPAEAKK